MGVKQFLATLVGEPIQCWGEFLYAVENTLDEVRGSLAVDILRGCGLQQFGDLIRADPLGL